VRKKNQISKRKLQRRLQVWIWYFSSHCKTDLLYTVPALTHTHKRGLTLDKKSLTSFKVLIILLDLHGKYSLGGLQEIFTINHYAEMTSR